MRLSFIVLATAILVWASFAATANPREIVQKSVELFKADWAAAPLYSYSERDVESRSDSSRGTASKTYRVVMIEGSPYKVLRERDDRPLSYAETVEEQRKLRREILQRSNESSIDRDHRIGQYVLERQRNQELLQEMIHAFVFRLTGEEDVDGRASWILDAESDPNYVPVDREGRVLTGMKGRLWIDQLSYQWVRAHAEVVRPIRFYGFLAKVEPGTAFDLEQTRIEKNVWMPKRFRVQVSASIINLFHQNSRDDETYRDYQPMSAALAALLTAP